MKKLTVHAELIKAYENRIKRLEEMAEAYEDYARCLENSLKTAKEFGAFKAAEVEKLYKEREEEREKHLIWRTQCLEVCQELKRTKEERDEWCRLYHEEA